MSIDKKLLIKLPEALVEKNDFGEQSLFFPIPVCLRNKSFRNTSGWLLPKQNCKHAIL